MTDLLYVKKGSAITLECPYHSVAIPVQWRGPTNLTVISDGNNIKDTLQHFNRLTITGQHEIGEYNLQVIDFNAADQGLYRCNSMVNGFAVQKDFIVHFFSKSICILAHCPYNHWHCTVHKSLLACGGFFLVFP